MYVSTESYPYRIHPNLVFMSTPAAQPISQSERITVLDSLRGIAILGILLMNIPIFSLPDTISYDPSVRGETGINFDLWYGILLTVEGTQRAIFSMLFGAGIILFINRQESRVTGLAPADYFFRRQLWLIAFSLFDVYILLWPGDILFDYACFGMLLFTFRKLAPKALFIAAGICLLLMLGRENRDLYHRKAVIERGEAVAAIDTTKTKLTTFQKKELEELNGFRKRSTHESKVKRAEEEQAEVLGGYRSAYESRTDSYIDHLVGYLYIQGWDIMICFLLGMAFYKTGVLTGTAPLKVYVWLTIAGLGLGIPLCYTRIESMIQYNYNWFEITKNVPLRYYQLDRILRSLGLFGLVMALYRVGWLNWLFAMLRPVGQMAFTNYLGQSLICSILFNGFALGLYGKLERYEIYLVTLSIWVFQIIFCNIWMRFFLYGPFEWLWRTLTYWKAQPFRKL